MFRKPRDDSSSGLLAAVAPSVGRPPTPPLRTSKSSSRPTSTFNPSSLRTIQSTQSHERSTSTPIKPKSKANQSILSFFKKEILPQKPLTISAKCEEDALFFDPVNITTRKQEDGPEEVPEPSQIPTPPSDHSRSGSIDHSEQVGDAARYNEVTTPVKKRRTGAAPIGFLRPKHTVLEDVGELSEISITKSAEEVEKQLVDQEGNKALEPKTRDASAEDFMGYANIDTDKNRRSGPDKQDLAEESALGKICSTKNQLQDLPAILEDSLPEPPPLKRESTSDIDIDGFEGLDDFIDDEFPEEGEEYQERQWMDEEFLQEQDMECDQDLNSYELNEFEDTNSNESYCPICNVSLVGIEDVACRNCLTSS